MSFYCYKCSAAQELSHTRKPPRKATCSNCGADLYVCKNCEFYDTNSYNDCREPQAERVKDKERANFCDYFRFREVLKGEGEISQFMETSGAGSDAGIMAAEDLFKK